MSMTPTTKQRMTLTANYSDRRATVVAKKWPNGDCWITARQLRDATRRAGICTGDYLVHLGGSKAEGYLVKTA